MNKELFLNTKETCKETPTLEICSAFSHSVRPDKDALIMPYPGDLERMEIRNAFAAYAWNDVPDELLYREYAALHFFTSAGFRYFLPAFMRSMTTCYKADEAMNDTVVWSLTYRPQEPDFRGAQLERFTGFSPAQGASILHFLEYMAANHDTDFIDPADGTSELQKAIGSWWIKYE